jgi:hypothetical protein
MTLTFMSTENTYPEQTLSPEAQAFVPAPFPTWPPPSGGAPVTQWEQSPKINPFPYGSTQTANISIAGPAPIKNATKYPQAMPRGANGQNQPQSLPAWPRSKINVLPDKADPKTSQITPAPSMGPGSTVMHLGASQIGRMGTQVKTFPAGSYIDGYGNLIVPSSVVRTIGGLGN